MALMLAKTYAAFKPPKYRKGSLPAGAELLDAIAAVHRVLAVQVRDGVEIFGDQAPKPPGWIPSLQARATLAAHKIHPQEALSSPAWRAGEKSSRRCAPANGASAISRQVIRLARFRFLMMMRSLG
jgi:hypothetical protein